LVFVIFVFSITNYVPAVTRGARVSASDAEPLARAFDAFEIMYANHTAREETLVFPAWKNALFSADLAEMGDRLEDTERETFGEDGFEDALHRIGHIEDVLGLTDLARFTAPAVPSRP
jgi:hypothetical protein